MKRTTNAKIKAPPVPAWMLGTAAAPTSYSWCWPAKDGGLSEKKFKNKSLAEVFGLEARYTANAGSGLKRKSRKPSPAEMIRQAYLERFKEMLKRDVVNGSVLHMDPNVAAAALETFESARGAVEWLTSPEISLKGRTPLEVASTKKGTKEVIILLKRHRDMKKTVAERSGYASPEEGIAALITAEGGCVSVDKACRLYRRPSPVMRQSLVEAIRRGDVIGYRARDGRYGVPVWQFRPEGGLIKGLREVLRALLAKVPGYDEFFPFAFFLQPNPVMDGRTPLAALRDGDIKKILDAINDCGH